MDVAATARSTRYASDPARQRACEQIWQDVNWIRCRIGMPPQAARLGYPHVA